MGSTDILVSKSQVLSTGYATMAVATVFTAARFILRWSNKSREFQIEDGFSLLSWVSFLVMAILYTAVTPALYRLDEATTTGVLYPTIEKDALFVIKVFFANTMIFWLVLWSVKLGLLFLFRRLFMGLPSQMKWWWGVLIFTLVMFLGCVITNFTSCQSMHAWFTPGECSTHHDAVAQVASLYFSFAVDVITDIMIMLLPWKLIWLLRLPVREKVALAGVFCVGIICIVMAIVRTVQVGLQSRNDTTPSSTWLVFWGEIEAAIAVIVGTLPSFGIFMRRKQVTRRYGNYNDSPHVGSKSRTNNSRGIPLSDRPGSDYPIHNPSKVVKLNGISVTRTLEVSSKPPRDTDDLEEDPLRNSYAR